MTPSRSDQLDLFAVVAVHPYTRMVAINGISHFRDLLRRYPDDEFAPFYRAMVSHNECLRDHGDSAAGRRPRHPREIAREAA